jgi:cold shock CspA family protein
MEGSDDREPGDVPPPDRFYAGTIKKLFPGAGMGIVLSASGREITFAAAHVILTGAVRRFEDLREGMTVGFDVGWTSKGLRVTVLHSGR